MPWDGSDDNYDDGEDHWVLMHSMGLVDEGTLLGLSIRRHPR